MKFNITGPLLITALVMGLCPDAMAQTNTTQKDVTAGKEHREMVIDPDLARCLPAIKAFIKSVQSKDKRRIAKFMELTRLGAANEKEFIKRFDLFFDDDLMNKIASSDPKTDWSSGGWRGIMLENGVLWFCPYDGKVTGINYETAAKKALVAKWLAYNKKMVHPSLVHFEQPIATFETKHYVIRIDRIEKGIFRYACWNKIKKMRQELYWALTPDLVLTGNRVCDGSGGNHHYVFKNGAYTFYYETALGVCSDESKAYLEVLRGERSLLKEYAENLDHWI